MEIVRLWRIFRRWWLLLAFGALFGVGAVVFLAARTVPVYQASTRLFINQVQSSTGLASVNDIQASQTLAKTYGELVTSRPVLQDALKQLHSSLTPDTLKPLINVSTDAGTQFLDVNVTNTDPRLAAAIANQLTSTLITHAEALQAGSAGATLQQIDQEISALRKTIAGITAKLQRVSNGTAKSSANTATIQQLQSDLSNDQLQYQYLLDLQQRTALLPTQAQATISVVEPAIVPTALLATNTRKNAILAALLGLALACGIVLLLERIDDRVRTADDFWQRFGIDPMATLPYLGHIGTTLLINRSFVGSARLADSLHLLRLNLRHLKQTGVHVVAVTSAAKGEGRSTVAANLALTEARAGKRVVLIDADLRDATLHQFFGLSNVAGLSTYLAQAQQPEPLLQTGVAGLKILVAGPSPSSPVALLGSARMEALLQTLRSRADLIVLDTAPVLESVDALVLQEFVDGSLVVVDARQARSATIDKLLIALQKSSATILGVVLNKEAQGRQEDSRLGAYIRQPNAGEHVETNRPHSPEVVPVRAQFGE